MSSTVQKTGFQTQNPVFQDLLSEIEWTRKDFESLREALNSPTPRLSTKEKNLQPGFQKVVAAIAYTSLLSLEIYSGFKYSFDMSHVHRLGLLTTCSILPTLGGIAAYQASESSYPMIRDAGIRLKRACSYLFF